MGMFDWLFGKKGGGRSGGAWQVGDRVLARWRDQYFYPARVRAVSGARCQVDFDDGDVDWVPAAQLLEPDVKVGTRVFARVGGGPAFFPGVVSQQKGETLQVRYDDGDEEWTTLSMVRLQRRGDSSRDEPDDEPAPPQPVKQAVDLGEPVEEGEWRSGDRVLARWIDLYWYPGTILGVGSKGFHILFDDGDQRLVTQANLTPLLAEEGEEVQIRPKNEPQLRYGLARITRALGETIDVEYDDGTVETNTKVSRARFWRSPVGARALPFGEGDRVLAQDIDDYVYPAEIISAEGDRIMLHFLDGPQRMLTPERLRRFELRPGQKVECRWKGGPNYFPGTLKQLDGDRAHVQYDDGDEEWTSVRLLRLKA